MNKTEKHAKKAGKKSGRWWKVLLCVVFTVAVFLTVINLIPPRKVMENNPFVKEEGALPMIAEHRGGYSAFRVELTEKLTGKNKSAQ